MKPFKTFISEMAKSPVDDHARAYFDALKTHLSDFNNFKKYMTDSPNQKIPTRIPTSSLDVPSDIKSKYKHFTHIRILPNHEEKHSIGLTGIERHTGLLGNLYTRFTKNVLNKPGNTGITLNRFHHLTSGLVSDPSMHKWLHTQTMNNFDQHYPIFRHEFQHVHQETDSKSFPYDPNHQHKSFKDYVNSKEEMDADLPTVRANLYQYHDKSPEDFAHINPSNPRSTKMTLNVLHLKDSSSHDRYLAMTSANKERVHSEVSDFVKDKFISMHNKHSDWREKNKPKVEPPKVNPMTYAHSSTYPASGIEGFKTFLHQNINKHTPEGVMQEPEEAKRQVNNFHSRAFAKTINHPSDHEGDAYTEYVKGSNDTHARDSFYASKKIKVPNKLDYENSPHIVSKYLNTMSKHFPEVDKNHGHEPINYHTNKTIYDGDDEVFAKNRKDINARF